MNITPKKAGIAGAAFLAAVAAFDDGDNAAFELLTQDTVTITVTKTERVQKKDGEGSEYMVWGRHADDNGKNDMETFKNIDSTLFWKFDSADVQGTLEVGETYTFDVAGWRWPFFSAFRNITSTADEIQQAPAPGQ